MRSHSIWDVCACLTASAIVPLSQTIRVQLKAAVRRQYHCNIGLDTREIAETPRPYYNFPGYGSYPPELPQSLGPFPAFSTIPCCSGPEQAGITIGGKRVGVEESGQLYRLLRCVHKPEPKSRRPSRDGGRVTGPRRAAQDRLRLPPFLSRCGRNFPSPTT